MIRYVGLCDSPTTGEGVVRERADRTLILRNEETLSVEQYQQKEEAGYIGNSFQGLIFMQNDLLIKERLRKIDLLQSNKYGSRFCSGNVIRADLRRDCIT